MYYLFQRTRQQSDLITKMPLLLF